MASLIHQLFAISEADDQYRAAERAWKEQPTKDRGMAWLKTAQRIGMPISDLARIIHAISGTLTYEVTQDLLQQIRIGQPLTAQEVIQINNPLLAFNYLLTIDSFENVTHEDWARLLEIIADDPKVAIYVGRFTRPWHEVYNVFPQPALKALTNIAKDPRLAYQYSAETIVSYSPEDRRPAWGIGGPVVTPELNAVNQQALQSIISVPRLALAYVKVHGRTWAANTPIGAAALQSIASTPETAFKYAFELEHRWIPGEPGAEEAIKNIQSNKLYAQRYKALINKKSR
jgi:hypothetical protein